jgi:hypothetical protein
VADLNDAKKNCGKWKMTPEQQQLVAPDRQSMLSAPIFAGTLEDGRPDERSPVIGILSVDSLTRLEETHWVRKNPGSVGYIPEEETVRIVKIWAAVIGRMLTSARANMR